MNKEAAVIMAEQAVPEADSQKESAPKDKIHYGLELLRIISMLFIVVLHVIGCGGISAASASQTLPYFVSHTMLAFAFCAVNIYALISGYVGVNSRFKFSKLIVLWLTVVSINLIMWVVFKYYNPASLEYFPFVNCFLPVSKGQYWYVTAYFGLYVLTPMLNAAAQNMKKGTYLKMLLTGIVLFVIMPPELSSDLFYTHAGYSMLWLMFMYLTGAYFKMHFMPKKRWAYILGGLGVYLISAVSLAAIKFYKEANGFPYEYAKYYVYNSLFVVACSVALFIVFLQISFKAKPVKAIVRFVSKATFGIYIIHTNFFAWNFFLSGRYAHFSLMPASKMIFSILFAAFSIFAVCMLIDKARALIFKIFYIEKLVSKIRFLN